MEQIPKVDLSSDCSLQLGYMKLELLVMAGQQHRREYVPGPCTHRPSHHGSWFYREVADLTARGEAPKVRPMTGMKS